MRSPVAFSLLAVASVGCAGMQVRHDPAADTAAIMEADKQFDLDTAAKGIDGWLPWFEENVATWTRAGLVHGRDHYKDNVGKLLAGGNQLRWVPVYGEVTGDLGFTTGTWKILGKDAQGQEQKLGSGKYFTVWRRQADGAWRIAFDIGNDDPK